MKELLIIAFAALALACNSCASGSVSPQPPPAPTVVIPDAGPVNDGGPSPVIDPGVRDACANLAYLKCAEGGSMCLITMQKALVSGITAVPLDCMVAAKTPEDVRACGFVPCE